MSWPLIVIWAYVLVMGGVLLFTDDGGHRTWSKMSELNTPVTIFELVNGQPLRDVTLGELFNRLQEHVLFTILEHGRLGVQFAARDVF
jgi:hypothetical protein